MAVYDRLRDVCRASSVKRVKHACRILRFNEDTRCFQPVGYVALN